MFERIKKAVKSFMQKTRADLGTAKEFKDIFELSGVPSFNRFYYFGIFIWKYLYRGYYKPWHYVPAPTISDPYHHRRLEPLNIEKAVCAELAGLIWNEQCEVHVSTGKELAEGETDPLDDFVQDVLTKNSFWTKMQEHIEQSLALGGGALKVWHEEKRDEEGKPIPGSGHIVLGYCMADQFVPTAWDNAKVTEGVFISRIAKNGYYFTRLEWHKRYGETYIIENEAFRAEQRNEVQADGTMEPQDILGFHYPLSEIWPFLNPSTTIHGITESLFAYYRTAIANNLDDNSPLGVSIYANALATLHALDICYDSFVREFVLGKKRIIVPTACIRTVNDPVSGRMVRYFDANDEAYEAMATDDTDQLRIVDNSVELRVDEHVSAINAFLSTLCLQLGFSAGTFTFDQSQGLKTATEIISENSKTYKTIKANQLQIKAAIERIVRGIIEVAMLYDVQWNGVSIASIAKEYEVSVSFDDSILQDRQTNINEGVLLMSNGVMSKKKFMTKVLGMTDEEAEQELKAIADERQVNATAVDAFMMGGEE